MLKIPLPLLGGVLSSLCGAIIHSSPEVRAPFFSRAAAKRWLSRVARNNAIDLLRRRGREVSASGLPGDDTADFFAATPDPDSPEPVVAVSTAEEKERLRTCIEKLGAIYREVVNWRYVDELDNEAVAAIVGIGRGSVSVRLHRAHAALKRCLI